MHQIKIQRERVDLFTYVFQPVLLMLIYGFLYRMTQMGNIPMMILLTLLFVGLTGFYVHYNFVRPRNEIVFEFDGQIMRIWEDDNPFMDNIEYEIFEITHLWVQDESFNYFFNHGRKLKCYHGRAELMLLDMRSFLFGGVNDADLKEVIDYLQTVNVNIRLGAG